MRHPVRVTSEAEQERQLQRDRQSQTKKSARSAKPGAKPDGLVSSRELRATREHLFKELSGRLAWAQGYFDRWGPGTPTHVYLGLSSSLDAYEASGDHDHGRGPIKPGARCEGGDCLVARTRHLLNQLPQPTLGPAQVVGRAPVGPPPTWRVSFVRQQTVAAWVRAESREEAETLVREGRFTYRSENPADVVGFTGCWAVTGKPEDQSDT